MSVCVSVCAQLCNCSLSLGMGRCFFELCFYFLPPTAPATAYKAADGFPVSQLERGAVFLTGQWNARKAGSFQEVDGNRVRSWTLWLSYLAPWKRSNVDTLVFFGFFFCMETS